MEFLESKTNISPTSIRESEQQGLELNFKKTRHVYNPETEAFLFRANVAWCSATGTILCGISSKKNRFLVLYYLVPTGLTGNYIIHFEERYQPTNIRHVTPVVSPETRPHPWMFGIWTIRSRFQTLGSLGPGCRRALRENGMPPIPKGHHHHHYHHHHHHHHHHQHHFYHLDRILGLNFKEETL